MTRDLNDLVALRQLLYRVAAGEDVADHELRAVRLRQPLAGARLAKFVNALLGAVDDVRRHRADGPEVSVPVADRHVDALLAMATHNTREMA